jgi:hypothetical protein
MDSVVHKAVICVRLSVHTRLFYLNFYLNDMNSPGTISFISVSGGFVVFIRSLKNFYH